MNHIPVFDGHNDVITKLHHSRGTAKAFEFYEQNAHGHIDYQRIKQGHFAGGFFAIFTANPSGEWDAEDPKYLNEQGYNIALPPAISQAYCATFVDQMIQDLYTLEAPGKFEIVTSFSTLKKCFEQQTTAAILHFEGVEMLHEDLSNLEAYYERGLRSLGPVWSRPNVFGHGVPFAFPSSPDTGPGLTPAGKNLIKRCNELGILIDLAHLNEKGFWDVAKQSNAPLVATHAAAWSLCHSSRNLTDQQLKAIQESNGVVGVNFAKGFIREDGALKAETSLTNIVEHVKYMVNSMGINHVAFGSDFDGADVPEDLKDVAGLPLLIQALREAEFTHEAIEKIAWKNWFGVLERTWKT